MPPLNFLTKERLNTMPEQEHEPGVPFKDETGREIIKIVSDGPTGWRYGYKDTLADGFKEYKPPKEKPTTAKPEEKKPDENGGEGWNQ